MTLFNGTGRGARALAAAVLILMAGASAERLAPNFLAAAPAPLKWKEALRRATEVVILSVQPPPKGGERPPRTLAYGITYKDSERLADLPGVKAVVLVRAFPQQARHLDHSHHARVVATTSAYADRERMVLAAGRFLNEEDDKKLNNVCVLGATAAARLFPKGKPVGETVQLRAYFYKVVGVRRAAASGDNDVYIPLSTCRARYGETVTIRQAGAIRRERVELTEVRLVLEKPGLAPATLERARKLLKAAHTRKDWDVSLDPPPVKRRAP